MRLRIILILIGEAPSEVLTERVLRRLRTLQHPRRTLPAGLALLTPGQQPQLDLAAGPLDLHHRIEQAVG